MTELAGGSIRAGLTAALGNGLPFGGIKVIAESGWFAARPSGTEDVYNWKQVKGKVKEKWGKLANDELDKMNGRRDQLEGKIQERYGIAKDQAKKDVDDWYNSIKW